MSKPKLELQVNMPQTIKLLQTEPATGENAYGQWFLYNVQSNGQELSFFAPDKIVKKFQEHQVQENDEVVITKRLSSRTARQTLLTMTSRCLNKNL
jgi:hypothetical protein